MARLSGPGVVSRRNPKLFCWSGFDASSKGFPFFLIFYRIQFNDLLACDFPDRGPQGNSPHSPAFEQTKFCWCWWFGWWVMMARSKLRCVLILQACLRSKTRCFDAAWYQRWDWLEHSVKLHTTSRYPCSIFDWEARGMRYEPIFIRHSYIVIGSMLFENNCFSEHCASKKPFWPSTVIGMKK